MKKINSKIPQNLNEKFIFIINSEHNYLDIEYNHKTSLNYINLFLILKFYISKEEFLVKHLYINSTDLENDNFKVNLFHKIDILKFKKMNFFEFKGWYDEIKENDYEYIKSLKFYGFRIIFYKESIFGKNDIILPIYPGNIHFKKNYINTNKDKNLSHGLFKTNKNLYNKGILFKKSRL